MQRDESGRFLSKSGRPHIEDGQNEILSTLDPNYQDPQTVEDTEDAKLKKSLDQNQEIEAYLYDGIQGQGYLSAPSGRGYLRPPNAHGGIFPLIPILSGLASMLFGGEGRKRGGFMGRVGMPPPYYHLQRPPHMGSISGFYKDMAQQAIASGAPPLLVQKKFEKLFGGAGMCRKVLSGKVGGGSVDVMKLGHLLSPILLGHIKKAIKGTGLNPDEIMQAIESGAKDIMEQKVDMNTLAKGGSILGSLWSGAKNIFGKVFGVAKKVISNPTVQRIGQKVLDSAADVAEKRLPGLAEKGLTGLADYAERRMRGPEPEPTPAEQKKIRQDLSRIKPAAPKASKKQKRRLPEPEPEPEPEEEEDEEEEVPLPPPRPKKKSTIAPSTRQTTRRSDVIVDYTPEGFPIYGHGKKKTTAGGYWSIKL